MNYTVIGAGPMGLMAAMELVRSGHSVDLYERDDRIGGMSASFNFDGQDIERYYHFICKTDQPLFDLLRELGLSAKLQWTSTKMGYYCDGRLYKWGTPLALLSFPKLGPVDKLRYALHVLSTKRIKDWRKLDRVNATSWLRKWLGARTYEVMWRRAFELKFFDYTENLSAAWIGTRIKRIALSRKNLFEESLGYLQGGSGTLLEQMEAFILERGGRIHLRKGIDEVITDGNRVVAVLAGGERIATDAVLSTTPVQYVPGFVPQLPEEYVAKVRAIQNIPVACVILKLSSPLTCNFWLNISDSSISIPGLIEYSNLNPESPNTIVYAPFYMPKSHPKWALSNQELIEEVLSYLPSINPSFSRESVLATHCHRYDYAQTICPPGFYEMLPAIKSPIEGLYIADTAYYYPEDRSISESIDIGKKLAQLAMT